MTQTHFFRVDLGAPNLYVNPPQSVTIYFFSSLPSVRASLSWPWLELSKTKKMAKKRDRRVATSSNRRKDRVESSTQQDQVGDSASSDRRLIIIFVFFFIVSPAVSILVYRIKYAPSTDGMNFYVYQRGLVKPDVTYLEILSVSAAMDLLSLSFSICFH